MSVILSSAFLSTIISGSITGAGIWVNYRNTGKPLEKYKRKLENKDKAFEREVELYKIINNIVIDLEFSPYNVQYCDKALDYLVDEFRKNEVLISEKVTKRFHKFIKDLNMYASILEDMEDAKDRQSQPSQNKHISENVDLNKKLKKVIKKMSKDFVRLRKGIKSKF